MENKYTLRFTFAIETQIDKLFTMSMCKYIKCSCECPYTTKSTSGGLKC
jgi:hypothetical protein